MRREMQEHYKKARHADRIYKTLAVFVEKAPLKIMIFSGVCGKSALAAFVVKAPLKTMIFSNVWGKSAAKDHDL